MLCGMIDIARESKDNSLLEGCKKLWNNFRNSNGWKVFLLCKSIRCIF